MALTIEQMMSEVEKNVTNELHITSCSCRLAFYSNLMKSSCLNDILTEYLFKIFDERE